MIIFIRRQVGGRNNNQNKNVQILRLKNKKQNLTRKTKKTRTVVQQMTIMNVTALDI